MALVWHEHLRSCALSMALHRNSAQAAKHGNHSLIFTLAGRVMALHKAKNIASASRAIGNRNEDQNCGEGHTNSGLNSSGRMHTNTRMWRVCS
jgi:hypothetical protein